MDVDHNDDHLLHVHLDATNKQRQAATVREET